MSETAGKVARIKEAMVTLVGRQGYEATTVEEICAEAGVSGEDFDRHFAGRQDCRAGVGADDRRLHLHLQGRLHGGGQLARRASCRRVRSARVAVCGRSANPLLPDRGDGGRRDGAGLPRRDDGRVHRDAGRRQVGGAEPRGLHPRHRRGPHRRGLRERDRLDQGPRGAERIPAAGEDGDARHRPHLPRPRRRGGRARDPRPGASSARGPSPRARTGALSPTPRRRSPDRGRAGRPRRASREPPWDGSRFRGRRPRRSG